MNRTYIDRHLVIDRYLQGKLADAEEAEFEERLVWDRELVDELELAENLQAGLRASSAESNYITDASESRAGRLKIALSMPRYAVAASFLMGALLTSMLINDTETMAPVTAPTTVVPLMVLRSADVQTIPVRPEGITVLMVDVPLTYPSYRVSIRREEAAEPFWQQKDLVPGYTEALAVGVPGSALAPAMYFLTIEGGGEESNTFVQEIPFKTVIAD